MLIKFNDSDKLYSLMYEESEGRFVKLSNLVDKVPENHSGFNVIDDFDKETVLVSHNDFTIVYNKDDNSITYANHVNEYGIYFLYDSDTTYVTSCISVVIDSDTEIENSILHETIPELEYNHQERNVQVIDENGLPNYKIVNNSIIEISESEKNDIKESIDNEIFKRTKADKIYELSQICQASITSGITYNDKHYKYELTDQNNLTNAVELAKNTAFEVPYHADGETCQLYTLSDIVNIYMLNQINLNHHITYYNQLKMYIQTLKNIDDIKSVKYGQSLEDEYLETYNLVMEQSKKIIAKYLDMDISTVNVMLEDV